MQQSSRAEQKQESQFCEMDQGSYKLAMNHFVLLVEGSENNSRGKKCGNHYFPWSALPSPLSFVANVCDEPFHLFLFKTYTTFLRGNKIIVEKQVR